MPTPQQAARDFLDNQKAFRLGCLMTEQSHRATARLSHTLAQDVRAGLRLLQKVDRDVPPAARRAVASPQYASLVRDLLTALRAGGRIYFTGCGATGRLAILMEAAWRRFWSELGSLTPLGPQMGDMSERVISVMAGGDFALIRSVEGFEDFAGFGRHQLIQAGVAAGDVVVAVTEGGETSFVIGTAWAGLEAGASVHFVFNNPADALAAAVERSREVIAEPRIAKLDLHSGPMAVAGSTRMQATTAELLVLAIAMEEALASLLTGVIDAAVLTQLGVVRLPASDRVEAFVALLDELEAPASLDAMARMVELEEGVYRHGGLVTYFADELALDIFTDTTERSPTFALPPFRPADDTSAAPSWAFATNPTCPSDQAWRRLLGRDPRSLAWTAADYGCLGAPQRLIDNPPDLTAQRVRAFQIGSEADPSRHTNVPNLATAAVETGPASFALTRDYIRAMAPFRQRCLLAIGPQPADQAGIHERLHVPCRLERSPLRLWMHLAAKLVFNTLSTATMGRLGRLAGNWMIYVTPGNKKLIDRSTRLVAELAGLDYDQACRELFVTIHQLQADPAAMAAAPSPAAATIARLAGRTNGSTR